MKNEYTIYKLSSNTIKWYTDGSRTDEGTGPGVFGPRTNFYEPMGKRTSIFQAEVYAIDRCVQLNLDRNYTNCNIAIMSDSRAAIMALDSHVISSRLVWECLLKLKQLSERNRVQLCWIPSHIGIEGNEMADSLARKGASVPFIGPEPFCAVGDHVLREELRDLEICHRNETWHNAHGMRQAKKLLGEYNRKRFEACMKMSKNNLRILTGFLTGHCRLREHLRKLRLTEEGLCRFCEEFNEIPEHILRSCEALAHKRCRYLGKYQLSTEEMLSLDPLLILRFLRETGLEKVL